MHGGRPSARAALGVRTDRVLARPHEFGGPVKPRNPESGVDYLENLHLLAAEVPTEGNLMFVVDSFIDLAEQVRCSWAHASGGMIAVPLWDLMPRCVKVIVDPLGTR